MVAEVASKLSDPRFSEMTIGELVARQPRVVQYVKAKGAKLGGAEGIVQTIFHAATLLKCAQRHHGRTIGTIEFEVLNHVAKGDPEVELKKKQPSLGEYIVSNVEEAEARKTLFLIALAIDEML